MPRGYWASKQDAPTFFRYNGTLLDLEFDSDECVEDAYEIVQAIAAGKTVSTHPDYATHDHDPFSILPVKQRQWGPWETLLEYLDRSGGLANGKNIKPASEHATWNPQLRKNPPSAEELQQREEARHYRQALLDQYDQQDAETYHQQRKRERHQLRKQLALGTNYTEIPHTYGYAYGNGRLQKPPPDPKPPGNPMDWLDAHAGLCQGAPFDPPTRSNPENPPAQKIDDPSQFGTRHRKR